MRLPQWPLVSFANLLESNGADGYAHLSSVMGRSWRDSSVVYTRGAAGLSDAELHGQDGKSALIYEHNHDFHHAMPLGIMMCVYCGERKNNRMNKRMHSPSVSGAKHVVVSELGSGNGYLNRKPHRAIPLVTTRI